MFQTFSIFIFYVAPVFIMLFLYVRMTVRIHNRYKKFKQDSGENISSLQTVAVRRNSHFPTVSIDMLSSFSTESRSSLKTSNTIIQLTKEISELSSQNNKQQTNFLGIKRKKSKNRHSEIIELNPTKQPKRQLSIPENIINLNKTVSKNLNESLRHTNYKKQKMVLKSRRSIVRLLVIIVFSFAFNNLPYQLQIIFTRYGIFEEYQQTTAFKTFIIASFIMYYSNSAINFFIYFLFSKQFRNHIKSMFSKKGVSEVRF